jgi:hypothetical protein
LKKLTKVDTTALFHLAVSLLGLGLLAVLTFNQTVPETDFTWQMPLSGSIFCAVCILGILAGLSPRRCSHIAHFEAAERSSFYAVKRSNGEENSTAYKGHHPTCGNFSSHVLSFGDKTFCSGCTGLVLGAIFSLAGSFLYFFVGFQIGQVGVPLFWLGFFGVLCGLLQYELPTSNSFMHFTLNVTFVLGAFFLLVGVDNINRSLTLNLYLLALIVYWITTRIMLSRVEHRNKCSNCSLKPCNLSFGS